MKKPRDFAERLREHRAKQKLEDGFKRHSYLLPRDEARAEAARLLREYPKAAYATAVESWRELPGEKIEFTVKRLPTAD